MPATDTSKANPADAASAVPVKFRFATKTALSLTLAYIIPMAIGWPQPQTAATTVMLIAATGMVSESLQKGVLRILGTLVGAVIGLSLIMLFPQDRMTYLLLVSLVVSAIIYLYNAYQGDSTLFMLTAVVTMMVFNGGDAEGAFLYGVDRAYMTAFGVIVYTLVGSLLWPVKSVDNTRKLAADVGHSFHNAFKRLTQEQSGGDEAPMDEQLTALIARQDALETHYAAIKNTSEGVTAYLAEWNAIVSCYEDLQNTLIPAMKEERQANMAFNRHMGNYHELLAHTEALFQEVESRWQGRHEIDDPQVMKIVYSVEQLAQENHFTVAAVVARAELLQHTQSILIELLAAMDSLLFDQGTFDKSRQPTGKPTFLWLDLENFKTAVRVFVTFWIAATIWMQFNPPGGFMFVTMCTVLIPLVSYTPVTPKLLFILFTLGFLFALPAYVFLLPNMTHWLQLAAFIFSYAFIGFYVLQGPVSIFFLLGLFTLGIQNTMSYNVDAILLIMLMFYMVCTLLIISVHFPFTSKPQRLYPSLRRRFFHQCSQLLRITSLPGKATPRLRLGITAALLAKMKFWGAQIDGAYFNANGKEQLNALNQSSDLLLAQLQVMADRSKEFGDNPLINSLRGRSNPSPLAELSDALAAGPAEHTFEQVRARLRGINERLGEFLGESYLDRYGTQQVAQFYVYLNLQASILSSLQACLDAQQALNWQQLKETKF